MCSTPFGITDFRTISRPRSSAGTSGAQRLSASQISARSSSCSAIPHKSGAQRLSASQISAHFRDRGIPHRCQVLNAFRHHRFPHASAVQLEKARTLCSTPFGITDFRTLLYSFPLSIISIVLNAFRHHRFPHFSNTLNNGISILCSTPFGITDFRTRASSIRSARDTKCSTPFGITDFRTLYSFDQSQEFNVLNAFRHHRFPHVLGALSELGYGLGAQRLSASQISAP